MVLKNKTVFVYDIEIFPNLFICVVKNTESKNVKVYEISDRVNDLPEIYKLFRNKKILFCGYNNLAYDSILINYLLIEYEHLIYKPIWEICTEIKAISDKLIASEKDKFNGLEVYKHTNTFESLDLLALMFSNKLRVGLKELQVTMEYPNVLQYDGDFNSNVQLSEIEQVIHYCKNDINSTEELLYRLEKDIELRLSVEKEYRISALNKDGVNLGMEILKKRYLEETGLTWNDIKELRSPCDKINLGEIVFEFIEFKTPTLQNILNQLKETTLDVGGEFEHRFELGGSIQVLASGGIHSKIDPESIEPTEDEILVDWDVASMYPSIIIEHKLYPQHLGEKFLITYDKIRQDRFKAKKAGNSLISNTLKLALNGLSGNLQSQYSWCYDPKMAYKLRINGQLLLLMLAESLTLIGGKIKQLNTDGALVLLDKSVYNEAVKIKEDWEIKTKLKLEPEVFERFYQSAVNDYVGVMKGWSETHNPKLIKCKGAYLENITLGKGMPPRIIAHAINKHLVEGASIEETIYNCQDIKMFLTYQKVSKTFDVEYNGKIIQHINRYYMSMSHAGLYKVQFDDGKEIKRIKMASSGVTLLNKFEDQPIPIKDRKINYQYYINEAYKIVNPLKVKQLLLF